jgi:hypothetical protein
LYNTCFILQLFYLFHIKQLIAPLFAFWERKLPSIYSLQANNLKSLSLYATDLTSDWSKRIICILSLIINYKTFIYENKNKFELKYHNYYVCRLTTWPIFLNRLPRITFTWVIINHFKIFPQVYFIFDTQHLGISCKAMIF